SLTHPNYLFGGADCRRALKVTSGRWGPPAGRGRRGCYYCRRDMRPTDFPDHRLRRRCPRPLLTGSGEGWWKSDQAEDALLDLVGQLGHLGGALAAVLGDRVATVLELVDRALDRAAALTQFALDAHTGFANLALEAVAGGDAAALEPFQLRLGLRRRGVGRDRFAHARDDAFTGDEGGADRDQHSTLGVVAEHAGRLTRGGLGLAHGRLGLVGGTGARALGV